MCICEIQVRCNRLCGHSLVVRVDQLEGKMKRSAVRLSDLMALLSSVRLRAKMLISLLLLSAVVVLHADEGFFYHSLSYSHALTIHPECFRLFREDGNSFILESDRWVLSIPGLTDAIPHNNCSVSTDFLSYRGNGVGVSLFHSLQGEPRRLRLMHLASKASFYRETIFTNFVSDHASAAGNTAGGARIDIEFSVTRSGTVRVISGAGYAATYNGGVYIIAWSGNMLSRFFIIDVTDPDPQNHFIVYSREVSFSYPPGGLTNFIDTVFLYANRRYKLEFSVTSGEHVRTVSDTIPPDNSPISAFAVEGGGSGAFISLFYRGGEDVPPEVIRSDVNGDGCVDDADLLAVMFCLGELIDFDGDGVAINADCLAADVNQDGTVDDSDLLTVLFHLGSCY